MGFSYEWYSAEDYGEALLMVNFPGNHPHKGKVIHINIDELLSLLDEESDILDDEDRGNLEELLRNVV